MSEKKKIEMDHVTIVVPEGKGKSILELAKLKGIPSGTVTVGHGTANKELLQQFDNKDIRRDIVSLVMATDLASIFLKELSEKYSLGKPGHGVAWATNINDVYTEAINNLDDENRERGEFQVITAIIKNNTAEELMDAARGAGATGGTILAPSEEFSASLFSKETKGNDDVVIIISKNELVESIMEAIRNTSLDNTKALVYLQDAHFVYGVK